MKKNNKMYFLIIMLFILIGMNYTKVYAKENIKVDINVGFENYYKVGYWTPFNLKIQNKLKDIEGEVQLELINEKDEINIYSKKVNLPLNSTKNINISGVIFNNVGYVGVKIFNGNELVYDEKKAIKPGVKNADLVIGVLSQEQENLNYLNSIKSLKIGGNEVLTKFFKIDDKDLEGTIEQLNMFNIIFMNNFDTTRLSQEKYVILKEWVNSGGILIIGTGSTYNKTLQIFKDDFLSGHIGKVKKIKASSLLSIVSQDLKDKKDIDMNSLGGKVKKDLKDIDINSLEIKFNNIEEILKDGNELISFKCKRGRGEVCVNSFDFGEEEFKSWKFRDEFVVSLLNNLIGESNFGRNYVPDQPFRNNYELENALSNLVDLPLPKGKIILLIICVYIVLISVVVYLILKKKDKREYMWRVVPLVSILFIVIIYAFGASTRVTNNIANVINIVEMDKEGDKNINSNANIFSSKRSDMTIRASEGMEIYPSIFSNFDVHNYYNSNYANKKRKVQLKFEQGPEQYIKLQGLPAFSNNIINVKNNIESLGKIESNVSYYDQKFAGNIKNNSGLDLEECFLKSGGNYIDIGSIKNGEEKNINTKSTKVYNDIYSYLNSKYPLQDYYSKAPTNSKGIDKGEYRRMAQKRDVISAYSRQNAINLDKPILMGWSNKEFTKDFFVNGEKTMKYEKNLVVTPINLTFAMGNNVEYPFGYFKPEYIRNKNDYSDVEKVFHGLNHQISFNIKEKINIESITFKYRLDILEGREKKVKQFIWNVKEQKWQEGDFREFVINKEDVQKYLSKDNILKIKFEMKNEKTKGEMPQILVKGSVK